MHTDFVIDRIVLREIRLQLKEPFRISSGIVSERRIALIQLIDANGIAVWSECVAGEYPNYSPETVDTAWLAVTEWIAPKVLGTSFAHPGELHVLLDTDIRGHEMAKAAVEMAAWTLYATLTEQSLARVIGGTQRRIPVGISLGIQANPAALVERAVAARRDGYHKIKLKIQPGADIEYVAAVRAALPDAHLMADANNAYDISDAAHLALLDEFGLMMIEQPLERALDAGRIINIKPGRVGGFAPSLAIHDLAQSNGIPVWCGGMLESGIGRAYNVALASLPNFTLPGDVSPSRRYWQRDIVAPEWTMSDDGFVDVPFDRTGIGVSIDVDYIDDLTVRKTAV
jgi:o-succinylbenzoate synthase